MFGRMTWMGVFLVGVLGCADVRPPVPRPPTNAASVEPSDSAAPEKKRAVLSGKASYYADALAGRKTANGERYDPKLLTAAHRSLPFGTVVEIARTDGRKVRVRINDRGPFGGEGRVIDVSRRAAEELGMIPAGVVDVTLVIVGKP
jgi:rare lipoprotein A